MTLSHCDKIKVDIIYDIKVIFAALLEGLLAERIHDTIMMSV